MSIDPKKAHIWIVGGGIAGMAAAVFAIRDAGVPGENVHILEQLDIEGARSTAPVPPRSPTGGSRAGDACSRRRRTDAHGICSSRSPHSRTRHQRPAGNPRLQREGQDGRQSALIDSRHNIVDASQLGLDNRDRLEMMRLRACPNAPSAPAVSTRCSCDHSSPPTSGRCGGPRS
ncbi:NAD(P)-binding protein, partial [Rhodococcus hoagii]|nr:NAD(P)-binding protein [Prescottella equi]